MAKTIKVPVMNLEVQLGAAGVKTFTSPQAETILSQIRNIKVGQEVVNWYDDDAKEFRGDTFCCGDYYKFSYTTKDVELTDQEKDCYGFPISYIGEEEGATTTVSNGVVKVTKA